MSIFNFSATAFAIAVLIPLILAFSKRYSLAVLSLFAIAGIFYYQTFDFSQKKAVIPFEVQSEVFGIVESINQKERSQELRVKLELPHSGKISVNAPPYLYFRYGDSVKLQGTIKKLPEETAAYFLKDGILGRMSFPKIEKIKSGQGNFLKAKLLDFRGRILEIFKNNLPVEKAALLSGITLGSREGFSDDLKNKMSLTGTTHLVALSGYNISVVALAAGAAFGLYLSPSVSFYLTVLVIFLFVLMTGAEASAVRAAIMGIIVLLANEVQRSFSLRNAIAIAAFLMVLYNPKVLVFDLGFQLSFLALLGIVYLNPVFKKILKMEDSGFFSWKRNLLTTLSAQLMVLPLLLGKFGIFSLTSLLANVLILEVVPLTMALGFILTLAGFLSGFPCFLFEMVINHRFFPSTDVPMLETVTRSG